MRVLKKVLVWIFALFCLCTVPVYGIFSVTGCMGLLVGILALPIGVVYKIWKMLLPAYAPKIAKPAILLSAFCVMVAAAPSPYTNTSLQNPGNSAVQEAKETLVPVPTVAPLPAKDPESTKLAGAENEWENVPVPDASTVCSGSSSLGDSDVDSANDTAPLEKDIVYVAGSGKGTRYHLDPTCSGMDTPVAMDKESAEKQGYTPCKRCCE